MKVPTILSEANINTGSTGPVADAEDFGGGVARGLGTLGQGVGALAQGAASLGHAMNVKKQVDDADWVNKSLAQEKEYLLKWMTDPENNTKESFAKDFEELAKARVDKYVPFAPSPRAAKMFQRGFNDDYVTMLHGALTTSAKTRVLNISNGVADQISQTASSYNLMRKVQGVDAGADMLASIPKLNASIDNTLGKLSPSLAREHKDNVTIQLTYAAMDQDPGLARKVLDTNPNLDEHTRHTLLNQIESTERVRMAANIDDFMQAREDWKSGVRNGNVRDNLDKVLYQSNLPRDKAQALYAEDSAYLNAFNSAREELSTISSWNGHAQATRLEELRSKITGGSGSQSKEDALKMLAPAVQRNLEQQNNDPAQFMMDNNVHVQTLARTGDKVGAARASFKFQGFAPDGATDEEKKFYLNRSSGDRSVVSKTEAKAYVETILKGTPSQRLDAIKQFVNQWPEDLSHYAYQDLVKAGLPQQYQAAFLNKDEFFVDKLMGTLNNSKAEQQLTPEKRAKFDEALDANPTWRIFSTRGTLSENFQRDDQLAGFRNTIIAYAAGIGREEGLGPDAAIKKASNEILMSAMTVTSVNGQNLWMMRDQGSQARIRFTDEQAAQLGKKMQLALQFFQPQEINTKSPDGRVMFPQLEGMGNERVRALRDAVMANGFFRTTPDGRGATLYYHNGAESFELRDHKNRAFMINFADLYRSDIFERRTLGHAVMGSPGVSEPTHPGVNTGHWSDPEPGETYFPISDLNFIDKIRRGEGTSGTPEPRIKKLKKQL